MNDFINAIGFSSIKTRKQLDKVIKDAKDNYDVNYQHKEQDLIKEERIKYYGGGYGIRLCGEIDEDGEYRTENFYPFVDSNVLSGNFDVDVIPRNDSVAFLGVCEDKRNGATILFRFMEGMDRNLGIPRYNERYNNAHVYFSGLSNAGMIILPVVKTAGEDSGSSMNYAKRTSLMQQAKEGNPEAIESLTLDEMDYYAEIQRRAYKEDVLSIVRSTFLPFGFENDQYLVIGEIEDVERSENRMTHEEVFILNLVANEIPITVAINRNDLVGDPMVGMRFKGVVWLQGSLDI